MKRNATLRIPVMALGALVLISGCGQPSEIAATPAASSDAGTVVPIRSTLNEPCANITFGGDQSKIELTETHTRMWPFASAGAGAVAAVRVFDDQRPTGGKISVVNLADSSKPAHEIETLGAEDNAAGAWDGTRAVYWRGTGTPAADVTVRTWKRGDATPREVSSHGLVGPTAVVGKYGAWTEESSTGATHTVLANLDSGVKINAGSGTLAGAVDNLVLISDMDSITGETSIRAVDVATGERKAPPVAIGAMKPYSGYIVSDPAGRMAFVADVGRTVTVFAADKPSQPAKPVGEVSGTLQAISRVGALVTVTSASESAGSSLGVTLETTIFNLKDGTRASIPGMASAAPGGKLVITDGPAFVAEATVSDASSWESSLRCTE